MLDDLRERLLHEGVKPGVVGRYVAELEDHLEDLGEAGSRDEALRRLGASDVLAAAMLAQPGVRSWTARAPWATLTLGPLLGLLSGWFFPTFLLFLGVRHYAAGQEWPVAVAWVLTGFDEHALPILIGWTAVAIAVRQRAELTWLLIGTMLTALLGGGLIQQIDWKEDSFGFGFQMVAPFTTVLGRSLDSALFNLIMILAPYAVLRKRIARSA